LSIDGGGMRGLYAASYLAALEAAFSQRRGVAGLDIGKAFDLIVGTSTGGILAAGLAAGLPPRVMGEVYTNSGAKIFPRRLPSKRGFDLLRQLFTRPKFLKAGDEALRRALEKTFGKVTIGELWNRRGIALAIPAVNVSTYRPWVFKTPHLAGSNHRDDGYQITDVCLATTAAPLFRSMAAVRRPDNACTDIFVDGGLWANNPIVVALVEALRITDGGDQEIEIYSLGTCSKIEGEIVAESAVHRGLLDWKLGGEAAKISIAAQDFAFDANARFLLPYLTKKVRIVRFPAEPLPAGLLEYLDLDETRPEGLDALIRQARTDADMTNSKIQKGTDDGAAIQALFLSMPAR